MLKYSTLIGALLIALSMQISALDNWHNALKPVFIGGALFNIGIAFKALSTPTLAPETVDATDAVHTGPVK